MGSKGGYAFITTAIFLLLISAALLYIIAHPELIARRYELTLPATTTTLATTATTTAATTNTTATTIPVSGYSADEEEGTIGWLEKRTFDLVNAERANEGLAPLAWNDEITAVCRMHSADMAVEDYFSHTGSDGSNTSYRLMLGGVYYWNTTGENIAKISIVDTYVVDSRGEVVRKEYRTFEGMAQTAVEGWMDSPEHRENMMKPEFDEAGMGIVASGESYYFTQNFIRRVACGYKAGPCCETVGYYRWCYNPWECADSICV